MKLFILSAFLALASARVVEKVCDGVIINGINHEKEILKEDIRMPYSMSVDYVTNVLYYTYTDTRTSTNDVTFLPAALNLKTKENYIITGVQGGFATTVDPKTHSVYIGGSDGIYSFDFQTKEARNMNIISANIWQIFANDGVYFSTYPEEHAFVYKSGKLDNVAGIGDTKALVLGVDKDENIFFSNSSGLFFYKKGQHSLSPFLVGNHLVNAFTLDPSEKLYFSTAFPSSTAGIFSAEVVDGYHKITKVARITNIYGMAIDSNGTFIYSTVNAIIRLKSTGVACG